MGNEESINVNMRVIYIYLHGNARSARGHVICRVKEHFVGSGF